MRGCCRRSSVCLWTILLASAGGGALGQGSLTPSRAPAATMKTLDQLEPRTPIASLPFTIDKSGSYYLTGSLASTGDGFNINGYNADAQGNRFERCAFGDNTGDGLEINAGASGRCDGNLLLTCAVQGNTGHGIYLFAGAIARVDGNRVELCSIENNTLNGILLERTSTGECDGNVVAGCTLHKNVKAGISIGVGCNANRVEGNESADNAKGFDVSGTRNFIRRNGAGGNTVNWDIATANVCLVVKASLAPAISGDSGGTAPGSTDPNANFTY